MKTSGAHTSVRARVGWGVLAALSLSLTMAIESGQASASSGSVTSSILAADDRWVALGDSYSAGVGLGTFVAGGCDRDMLAYSPEAYRQMKADGETVIPNFSMSACSGATTQHYWSAQGNNPAQKDSINRSTKVATMTFGGNDIKFADKLVGCILGDCGPDVWNLWAGTSANDSMTWDLVFSRLVDVYVNARSNMASDGHLLVLSYPTPFALSGITGASCSFFEYSEQLAANALVTRLDDTIWRAVQSANTFIGNQKGSIEFIDWRSGPRIENLYVTPSGAKFAVVMPPNGLCNVVNKEPTINGLKNGTAIPTAVSDRTRFLGNSFHPTQFGYREGTSRVRAALLRVAPQPVVTPPGTTPPVTAGGGAGSSGSCNPPVPSGSRGVADSTQWTPDPCSGVYLRNGATNSATIIGDLAQGIMFDIVCQVYGGSVTDSRGYASTIWNKLAGGNWVSDTWSGHKGWMNNQCTTAGGPTSNGCNPPVPAGAYGVADSTAWNADPCSGAYVRNGPNFYNNILGELAQGSTFNIICQVYGGSVTDSRGYASTIWNKTNTPGFSSWVSDTWSGHKGWMNIPCGAPSGCNPAVPSGLQGVSDTTAWNPDPCSGVNLRPEPSLTATPWGELSQGSIFDINCQRHAQLISDSRGYQSDIWNNVTVNGRIAWIADTWSGKKGWLDQSCEASLPTGSTVQSVTPGDQTAVVTWAEAGGNGGRIIEYELGVQTNGTETTRSIVAPSSARSQAIDGLTNAASHAFRVRARNYKGWGPWSGWSVAVIPRGAPYKPGAPTAATEDESLSISWDWPKAADNGQQITETQVKLMQGSTVVETTTVGMGTQSVTFAEVDAGGDYLVQLRVKNGAGWSPWSAMSDPSAVSTAPDAPMLDVGCTSEGATIVSYRGTLPIFVGDGVVPMAGGRTTIAAETSFAVIDSQTSLVSRRTTVVPLACGAASADLTTLAPARLFDSRPGSGTIDGVQAALGRLVGGSTTAVSVGGRGGVPTGTRGVVLNVTVVDAGGPGFVTVFPCGTTRPLASNLNFTTSTTIPNAVIAKVAIDGTICVFTSAPIDLVIDVNGYVT